MTSFAKWRPTMKIVPKNHIVSSDFAHAIPFVPSYENEPPDMQMIMSNAYAAKWYQEKSGFKKKLIEFKHENEVFLMRRYVLRGHNKKMRNIELMKKVPSRIKVGKKVPFAVSLRPPDGKTQPTASKSKEKSQNMTPKSTSSLRRSQSLSRRDKKVEIGNSFCEGEGEVLDGDELARKLNEIAQAEGHLHAEQTGRKFKLYRVKCRRKHHHECDCEIPKPDK